MQKLLLRFGGFGTPVILGLTLSLITVPVVIRFAGARTWADIAVTQSIVAFAALVVMAGWGVGGPTRVALAQPASRPRMFRDALVIRSVLFVLALAPTVAACVLITDLPLYLTAAAVLAYLMPALSSAWFYVGESRPGRLLVLETLPQTLGTITALSVLVVTKDVGAFLMVQFGFALAGVLIAARVVLAGSHLRRLRLNEARRLLADQWSSVATAATGSLYANSPLIIGALFVPPAVMPTVALAYKLFKVASGAIGPYTQILQGSVPSLDIGRFATRARRALGATAVLALGGGAVFALLEPVLARAFSGGVIEVPVSVAVPFGAALAAICLSQVAGLVCLMGLGEGKAVALSTALGAMAGVPLLLLLALLSGAQGLAWAFASAEWLVTIVQLFALRRVLGGHASVPRRASVLVEGS